MNLAFNQLSAPTLDGLIMDMYNGLLPGLPLGLQSNLLLDLPNHEILFRFSGGQSDYFVQNLSTDTGVGLSGGLTYETPEPSTMLLAGTGVILLALAWCRVQRTGTA